MLSSTLRPCHRRTHSSLILILQEVYEDPQVQEFIGENPRPRGSYRATKRKLAKKKPSKIAKKAHTRGIAKVDRASVDSSMVTAIKRAIDFPNCGLVASGDNRLKCVACKIQVCLYPHSYLLLTPLTNLPTWALAYWHKGGYYQAAPQNEEAQGNVRCLDQAQE